MKDIGFLIKQISEKLKASADNDMKGRDLTYSQFHVLCYLGMKGGEASQKEIEEYLGVSHPTVAGLISRLEGKGFVATRTDERDRRIKIVTASEKASALGDELRARRVEGEKMMCEGMSDEETEELARLLEMVLCNVTSDNFR